MFLAAQKVVIKHHDLPRNSPQLHHDLPPQITAKCPLTPTKARFSRPDI
jgi:hypothetical protein